MAEIKVNINTNKPIVTDDNNSGRTFSINKDVTRRDFLKGFGAVLAFLGMSGFLVAEKVKEIEKTKVVKEYVDIAPQGSGKGYGPGVYGK